MRSRTALFCSLGAIAVSACGSTAYAGLPCKKYTEQDSIKITEPLLNEISGLANSRSNPDYLWAHVDSNGPASLYLLNHEGQIVHTFSVADAVNVDWEDIAIGPCTPGDSRNCIYIADLGDNGFCRTDKKILIIPEPNLSRYDLTTPATTEVEILATQWVTYPAPNDGEAAYTNPDSESIMVDPLTADMYVLSKHSTGGFQTLFYVPRAEDEVTTLEPLGNYTFSSNLGNLKKIFNAVTAADFAPDGTNFVIRTYAHVYQYDLLTFSDLATAFANPQKIIDTRELQGEAVAYASDGKSLITAGENYSNLGATMSYFSCIAADNIISPDDVTDQNQLPEEQQALNSQTDIPADNHGDIYGRGGHHGCQSAGHSADLFWFICLMLPLFWKFRLPYAKH